MPSLPSKRESRLTPRFLLWVYLVLLGLIVFIAVIVFAFYGLMASSTKEFTDIEAHKTAVATFGNIAQSFSDLVKVTVGAVIGALSATLQFILSSKEPNEHQIESKEITSDIKKENS